MGQFFVPDVKSKMRQAAPPTAGWMEARSKLQTQLDSLIAKTSAKMTKYGTVHAIEPKEVPVAKEISSAISNDPELETRKKPPINPVLTSLIKSVANEIQKSFSSKSLANCDDNDEDDEEEEEETEKEVENDVCDENNNTVEDNDYWRNNEPKHRQPQIDMEAPIDFDYDEPSNVPAVLVEEDLEEDVKEDKSAECTEEQEEVPSDSLPTVLDASLARSKADLMRRTERRLPAHVLARRRAADKVRGTEQLGVVEQIKRDLADASQQVDLLSHQQDLETLDDEEKVDLIAKHMSKMETGYIMKLLKQLEAGILDLSVPMLLPFLSLQVKLDLGRNIFKSLEPRNKEKVVKENFINDMISDITDIALLQEVIDRTQEKINYLCPPQPLPPMSGDYFNIENDSYELPSTTLNIENDSYELSPQQPRLTDVLSHIEKLMKEGSKKEEAKEKEKEKEKESEAVEASNPVVPVSSEVVEEAEKIDASELSDDSDLPSSECDSGVVEDVEEKTAEENIEKTVEKKECGSKIEKEDLEKKKIDDDIMEDTTENIPPKTLPAKENNETVIKKKLRNILENCKTNEQTRPARNFGRNFEFQNVQLKPVVPNDKRTPKAKRMDDMWMNTIASKQKWPCNNQLSAPKPKVPWTMNKNTQPQKQEVNTEVKEFEACHKSLKDVESKQMSVVKEVIKQSTATSPDQSKIISKQEKESNLELKEVTKKNYEDQNEEDFSVKKEDDDTNKIVNENKHIAPEAEEKVEIKELDETVDGNRLPVKIESATRINECAAKVTSKYKQPQIDMEAPIDFGNLDTSHVERASQEIPKRVGESTEREVISKSEENKTAVNKKSVEDDAGKGQTTGNVPSTPTVRRRGDTFTVVLPLREKPPPPPMAKPPPPPMSPPVPAARVQELEREEKMGKVDKKEETECDVSEDIDEESEWEWTEEEEDSDEEEEGNTYEVNKEGWENIMSTSKGPTTFKAEYSIKVGGR